MDESEGVGLSRGRSFMKRRLHVFLILGILLWIAGGGLVIFGEPTLVRLIGAVLFAAGIASALWGLNTARRSQ